MKYLLGFEEIEIDVVESFQYRMYEYKRRFYESKKASRGDTDKGAFLRAELENKLSLEITEMYRDALFLGADRDLLQEKLKIVFPESKITAVAAGEKPYQASDYLNQ